MSADATANDVETKVGRLRHSALRNALYHTARFRLLDSLHRWFSFLVILLGTGTVAEVVRGSELWAIALGGAVSAIGALQLVFDYAGRAHRHEALQKRYYRLLADIDRNEAIADDSRCSRWLAKISQISADEPPVKRALDAIADNQATFALRNAVKPRLHVTWWQSLTRHCFAHNGGEFKIQDNWEAVDLPGA